jgi:hypothetical protein
MTQTVAFRGKGAQPAVAASVSLQGAPTRAGPATHRRLVTHGRRRDVGRVEVLLRAARLPRPAARSTAALETSERRDENHCNRQPLANPGRHLCTRGSAARRLRCLRRLRRLNGRQGRRRRRRGGDRRGVGPYGVAVGVLPAACRRLVRQVPLPRRLSAHTRSASPPLR